MHEKSIVNNFLNETIRNLKKIVYIIRFFFRRLDNLCH